MPPLTQAERQAKQDAEDDAVRQRRDLTVKDANQSVWLLKASAGAKRGRVDGGPQYGRERTPKLPSRHPLLPPPLQVPDALGAELDSMIAAADGRPVGSYSTCLDASGVVSGGHIELADGRKWSMVPEAVELSLSRGVSTHVLADETASGSVTPLSVAGRVTGRFGLRVDPAAPPAAAPRAAQATASAPLKGEKGGGGAKAEGAGPATGMAGALPAPVAGALKRPRAIIEPAVTMNDPDLDGNATALGRSRFSLFQAGGTEGDWHAAAKDRLAAAGPARAERTLDKAAMETAVLGLFQRRKWWKMADLVRELKEPQQYVKEATMEVARKLTVGPHSGEWALKPEYQIDGGAGGKGGGWR